MLIQANERHRKMIFNYLKDEPVQTLFISADIEQYGFDEPFQTVWIVCDEHEDLKAVFLKYYDNYIVYSKNQDYPLTDFEWLVKNHEIGCLSMTQKDFLYVQTLIPDTYHAKKSTMTVLEKPCPPSVGLVRMATVKDARKIVESMDSIEEFRSLKGEMDLDKQTLAKEKSIADGFNIHFVIDKDDKIIANANSSCMSSKAAMLGGVFCLPEHRRQGHAKRVVSALCNYLQFNNLQPCLFFTNPAAGKMYHDLGFVDIDTWYMIVKNH